MDIIEIRKIAAQERTAETAAALETACKSLLLFQPASIAAELLFLCAEAIAFHQDRRSEASPFAYRASDLADQGRDIMLAIKARCYAIYCDARSKSTREFWNDRNTFYDLVVHMWIPTLREPLTPAESREINERFAALSEYGTRLAAERGEVSNA